MKYIAIITTSHTSFHYVYSSTGEFDRLMIRLFDELFNEVERRMEHWRAVQKLLMVGSFAPTTN
jgi:hypothetical protein